VVKEVNQMDNQTEQPQAAPVEQPATVQPAQAPGEQPGSDQPTVGTQETPAEQPLPAEPTAPDTGADAPADQVEHARVYMNLVLDVLREKRSQLQSGQPGGRELSEAITLFETGCMWMIRSQFADQPYSPLTRLKPATE
jgi:hypothetical protein